MPKKVLITGANGQLGNEIKLASAFLSEIDFVFTDIDELDITDIQQLKTFFPTNNIDIIVNCAAYTAVDKAEEERGLALQINSSAVKNLALAASEFGSALIHISTDFIFNGEKGSPYCEDDTPDPISWYGYTKLEGEKNVINSCNNSVTIRTSWLYSSFGQNFVKKIIELGKTRKNIRVVSDQIGNPTYARDLARVILEIIRNSKILGHKTYHYSNEGIASWYDFAKEIILLAGLDCDVQPIPGKEYPTLAKRPKYSVMNKAKIKQDLDIVVPDWKASLNDCINSLSENNFV